MQDSERLHAQTSEKDNKYQGSHQSPGCFEYISLFFHKNKQTKNLLITAQIFLSMTAQSITKLEAKPKHQYIHALET